MENYLKHIREEKGMTQYELADFLDISQKTISAWEKGTRTPRPMMMQKIENEFNIPKEKIFFAAFGYVS